MKGEGVEVTKNKILTRKDAISCLTSSLQSYVNIQRRIAVMKEKLARIEQYERGAHIGDVLDVDQKNMIKNKERYKAILSDLEAVCSRKIKNPYTFGDVNISVEEVFGECMKQFMSEEEFKRQIEDESRKEVDQKTKDEEKRKEEEEEDNMVELKTEEEGKKEDPVVAVMENENVENKPEPPKRVPYAWKKRLNLVSIGVESKGSSDKSVSPDQRRRRR
jgi:hypothetical protein